MSPRKAKAKQDEKAARSAPEELLKHSWKPGQSGNPAGRPKGSKDKLNEDFLSAMCADFKAHGEAVIARVREDDPTSYLKVVAGILPKESKVTVDIIDNMSTNELRDYITGEIEALGISRKAPALAGGKGVSRPAGRLN